jgi:hypothetical protein
MGLFASDTGSNLVGNSFWEYKDRSLGGTKKMSDQDDVDQNVPASPENEDGLNDEEDLEEDDGSLVIEEEDEEGGDYYLHRIDRLLRADERDQIPTLYNAANGLFSAWTVITASGLPVNLDKREFDLRLRKFLKQQNPKLPDVTPALADFLFERAVHAHKLMAAWHVIVKNAKRPDLDKARQYFQQELKRYVEIRSLVREQREKMPSWMKGWAYYWLGAFEQIEEEIESQLRSTKDALDSIAGKRASTRIEIESFILWREKDEIRKQIAETEFGRSLEALLAAFAYAARLIPESKEGIRRYSDLIKQRASRVSRSGEKRSEALVSLLTTMLEIPNQQSGHQKK